MEELNDLEVPSALQRELWQSKARKQQQRDGRTPRWTAGSMYRILRSPLHAGLVHTPSGEIVQGQHWQHRFWKPEVLEQIEHTRQRVSRFKTGTGQRNTPHLLNGVICWLTASTRFGSKSLTLCAVAVQYCV